MSEPAVFTCSICEAVSRDICVYCTKDTCPNHLCLRCRRCSDCCVCEVPRIAGEIDEAAHNGAVHSYNGSLGSRPAESS